MPEIDKNPGGGERWTLLFWLPLIAAVVVLLSGCAAQSSQPAENQSTASGGEKEQASRGGNELGHPVLGDPGAPVVMVEYGDFQWLFCGKFAREVEPKLVQEYVESGTLRMEWRDFPYLGQESVNAAVAARAAQEQGKFWEYHDLLYHNQPGGFQEEKLVELAREAGLDEERFRADLASGEYEQVVAEDFKEGQQRGISGTPTFVINGRVLAGMQPAEVFESAIEQARREAEGES